MADPIIEGTAVLVAMFVAALLIRNYWLKQASSGKSLLPIIQFKQNKKWINGVGGMLAVVLATMVLFGVTEQYTGLIDGGIDLMKQLPGVGPLIPFSAYQAPLAVEVDDVEGVEQITPGSEVTPDLLVNAYNAESAGTALTEVTNIYRPVGETTWSVFTAGTEITGLEPLQVYEFVMGINTTHQSEQAYGQYFKYRVQNKEDDRVDKPMYNDEVETSVSATFYNEDENAAAQTLTAGQVKTVYLKFESGKDEVYGNPYIAESGLSDLGQHSVDYPNVLLLRLNKTTFEKPVSVRIARSPVASEVGVELDRVSCPTLATTSAASTDYCFEAPVIRDSETRFAVQLEADGTSAPDVDGTAELYAGNFYIHADTAALEWGIEDEDGNAAGASAADSLTLDFTA